jgi:hypothetical protein
VPETPDSANVTSADTPADPGNQVMYKKTFKIMQVISPGRALAQEIRSLNGGVDSDLSEQIYLLTGIPRNVVDDETWGGWVFPGDIFSYTTAQNATKTVKSFIVSTNQDPKNVKVNSSYEMGNNAVILIQTPVAYPDTNADVKPSEPTQ